MVYLPGSRAFKCLARELTQFQLDCKDMNRFPGFSRDMATQILQSPFYRHLCDRQGLVFPDLLHPEVLDCFPILTRQDLANFATEMLVDPATALPIYSSGTTGQPLRVYRNMDDDQRHWNIIRSGCELLDETVLSAFFLCSLPQSLSYQLQLKFSDFYVNIERYNLWQNPDVCREKVQSASLILGSPEGIRWILQEKIKPRASAYYSTALPLSAVIRERVQSWSTRLFHTYSSTETGPIAWQCALDVCQYHVFPDTFVEAGAGDAVLVTKMFRTALPLLRYSTGDRAELTYGLCSCGFQGSTLVRLQGRKTDQRNKFSS